MYIHFKLPLTEAGGILERLVIAPALMLLCAYLAWPVIKTAIINLASCTLYVALI